MTSEHKLHTDHADLIDDLDALARADASTMPAALPDRIYLASAGVLGKTGSGSGEDDLAPVAVIGTGGTSSRTRIAAGLALMGAVGAVLLATLNRSGTPLQPGIEPVEAAAVAADEELWLAVEDAWGDSLWGEIDVLYAETASLDGEWTEPDDDASLEAWLEVGFGAGGAM